MPNFATTNPLKGFAFIKTFGRNIVKNTGVRQQMNSGNLQKTGVTTGTDHSKLSQQAQEANYKVQKNKTPHDRLIDYYV